MSLDGMDTAAGTPPEEAYNYRNTRPLGVFGLAGIAAFGALSVVWAAWSTLEAATRDQRLAEPPDLKHVVQSIESKARAAVPAASGSASDAQEGEARLAGENPDDDQSIDDAV